MRVTNYESMTLALERLQTLSADVVKTQQQISSGRRVNTAADDPVAAGRIARLSEDLSIRQQYVQNVDQADNALAHEDIILGQVVDVIHRTKEIALQAGNGIQTLEDRRFLAIELRTRFDEMLGLMNSQGPDGSYLFGGFQSRTEPFEFESKLVYRGDDGHRELRVDNDVTLTVSDSGRGIFLDVPAAGVNPSVNTEFAYDRARPEQLGVVSTRIADHEALQQLFPHDIVIEFQPLVDGGGVANYSVSRLDDGRPIDGLTNVPYQPGSPIVAGGVTIEVAGIPIPGDRLVVETVNKRSALDTIDSLAYHLETIDPESELEDVFAQELDLVIHDLDSALDTVLTKRAQVGSRLNTADSLRELHQDIELQSQTVISQLRDVDFVEAVSRLSSQSFVLEAAQQSFIRVSNLSLFNQL